MGIATIGGCVHVRGNISSRDEQQLDRGMLKGGGLGGSGDTGVGS
jgi:hypothetical protein